MKGGHTGNSEDFSQEKACEPLRKRPMGMDQIESTSPSNPQSATNLGENEEGQLQKRQGAFLRVFQDPRAIAQLLEFQRIEIRKTKNLDSFPEFMPLAAIIMGSDDYDFYPERLQLFA